jgi:lipoate-protein ligase A
MAGGRKLIGSAQIRVNGVLLQHGSIPFRASSLAAALEAADQIASGSPAELETVIGHADGIDTDIVIGAVSDAWSAAIGPVARVPLDSAELDRAAMLTRRFQEDAWTWRR